VLFLTAASERADQVTVQPADPVATAEAEHWLKDYASSRDAALRERIILAYLGLADRIASRYRHSRGTTLEVDRVERSAGGGLLSRRTRARRASHRRAC
jgi:hypothetical protein